MIHPNSEVQWMDIKDKTVHVDTIAKMFQKYSHRSIKRTLIVDEISFINDIKITDMHGWTDVINIQKIQNDNKDWVNLYAAGNNLKITLESIIPIYQPDSMYKGFHGESKYHIDNKFISFIDNNDMVRIKRNENVNDEYCEFSNVKISLCESSECGYRITTKSRFFNVDNIHLTHRDY